MDGGNGFVPVQPVSKALVKGDAEKGELLAVMYPKGLDLADADGDFADSTLAIKSMTTSLIQNGGQLDLEHDGEVLPAEAASITEVFTIQKSDSRFHNWKDYKGNPTDVTGGCAVQIQIDDPGLRKAYRDGEWDGVSVFGPAVVEDVDIKAASQRVAARMGAKENDMTKEEMQALLDAQEAKMATLFKSAVAEAVKEVKDAGKPAEMSAEEKAAADLKAKQEEAPVFSGDPTDPEALATYENALRGHELRKAIASGDMTADKLAEMRKSMGATAPTVAELNEAGIKAEESDSKEVRDLQVKLFKSQNKSNVPVRMGNGGDAEAELRKSQHDEGMAIAGLMNGMMGNHPDSGGMKVVSGS